MSEYLGPDAARAEKFNISPLTAVKFLMSDGSVVDSVDQSQNIISGASAGYWQNDSGQGGSDLVLNPRLSSTYNLLHGSPAINGGTDVGLTSDIEGNSVPYGAKPDIGAYEYRPKHFWNF